MKKTLSLLLFVVLAWPLSVFGQLSNDVRSLKGIDGFDVVVERIPEDSERAGFSRKEYENAIELRLRSLGIQIDEDSSSYLYLNVNPNRIGSRPLFALSVTLSFKQSVLPIRSPKPVTATTWDVGFVASIGEDRIRNGDLKGAIIGLVDDFANDYFKANPPEPRSGQGDE